MDGGENGSGLHTFMFHVNQYISIVKREKFFL